MTTASVNGAELYYEERGSGPPLLLIHGTGAHTDLWTPVVDGLARTHRVIAYDRRGFARSTPSRARFADHARDAAALLRALDAAPATVVGWSGGGVVALDLAASDPDCVTELFLAEAAVHLLTRPTRTMLTMQAKQSARRYVRRDKEAAAQTMYRWSSGWSTGGNAFDGIPQDWQDRMVGSAASTLREMDQMLRLYPSRKAISSITCPVTLIEGDLSDKAFPKADAFLSRLLPQARLVTLPEAGHFLHVDQPERFVEAIAPTLSE